MMTDFILNIFTAHRQYHRSGIK